MKSKKIIKNILIIVLTLTILLLSGILIFINVSIKPVKNLDLNLSNNANYSKIYSNDIELTDYSDGLINNYINIELIPEITKNAFISIEDKNFYKHNGLNIKRIAKAGINNLLSRELKEGASTITQQLVKNRYLSNEKTFDRKVKEAYLAIKIEQKETKDQILESYLNTIYFGNGAYGIGEAAKIFFNKNVEDLNLIESATLAGIIKSPKNYSPINNYENSNKRKNLVLKEMLEDSYITIDQYNVAINQDISIDKTNQNVNLNNVDLYSQYVLEEASRILNTNIYNVIHGGYKIYTYQNKNIQKILDEKINDCSYYQKNEYGNIADSLAMVIDNETCGVSAVSGKSKYNLVNFKRQPGSLIKPILTYLPALELGLINEKTQILDEEINYNGYSPNNVGNKFYGYVSIEDAVAKSLNIPAIKITEKVGINNCKEYAKKCGIEFNENYDNGYSIALGGFRDGVNLKSITDSYSVLTHGGNYIKSSFIKKITSSDNVTLYSDKLSFTPIYNEDTTYLMTNILKYSVNNGTSKKLSQLNFDIAGKTGTVAVPNTNFNTDAYSLAFTTNHTMSVWLGNYSMEKEYNLPGSNNGGTYATMIIKDTFEKIYESESPDEFFKPDNVIECIIDQKSLMEDHIVVSGINIPERYQTKCLISKRYTPLKESTKFITCNPFSINVELFKNSCKIKFDTNDYTDYTIYREYNSKSEVVDVVKNSSGEYCYIDKNINNNTNYYYYVVAKNNYSNTSYTTEKKQVFIEKEYSNVIENNNIIDYAWLFT